jgi:hypothetical protein
MVAGFDHLGVVEARPGPVDGLFPPVVEVEDQHLPIVSDVTDGATAIEALTVGPSGVAHASAADVDLSGIEKVNRFPGGLR